MNKLSVGQVVGLVLGLLLLVVVVAVVVSLHGKNSDVVEGIKAGAEIISTAVKPLGDAVDEHQARGVQPGLSARPRANPCTWIPGVFKQIDAGSGYVVGVNKEGLVNALVKGSWVRQPGFNWLHVSAGPAGIWGVQRNNSIYKLWNNSWIPFKGWLKQIDAGGSQFIGGVNNNNDIFCWPGGSSSSSKIDGKLKYYSCGPRGCWGVDSTDNIFYRHGVSPRSCSGSRWELVRGHLSMIEVGTDSSVYGVDGLGVIYYRVGITAHNPIGTGWSPINLGLGKIKHVTYDQNILWALTSNGAVWRCPLPKWA